MKKSDKIDRRAQLFELLRQQNMTDIALARAKTHPELRVETDDITVLKSVAAKSFSAGSKQKSFD